MSKTSILHWHSIHNDWLRALNFYKGELKILRERLTEIARRNSGKDVRFKIEHFENQFTLHIENIARLQHSINTNIVAIVKEVAIHSVFLKNDLLKKLDEQKKQYSIEEENFNELRHSFNEFSAEWM